MNPSSPKRKRVVWIFLSLFVLFDIGAVAGLVRQWQSGKYTATSGRILRSEGMVEHWKDSDNRDQTSESWALSFEYQAGGRRHVGNKYRRWFKGGSEFFISPFEMASRFPAGTTRTVYFDPANPSFAVMEAGLQRSDLLFAAGLGLVNFLVALVAWPRAGWALVDRVLALVKSPRKNPSSLIGGVRVQAHENELQVWVTPSSPLGVAIGVFLLAVIVLFWMSVPNSMAGWIFILAIAYGLAAWAARHQRRAERTRGPDLIFDAARSLLTRRRPPPPLASGREEFHGRMVAWGKGPHEPVVLPFQAIRAIDVSDETFVEKEDNDGAQTESVRSVHHVAARVVDAAGNTSKCRLATMSLSKDADAFATWVRSTLGLI